MALRPSMAALISRTRLLINDTAGASQTFADQDVQDVLDESRQDIKNQEMIPRPTFVTGTVSYLDYYTKQTDWEDDFVLKQYLINTVTPALSEPIIGHWQFATSTLPSVFITGKTYDIYRAAADLLERWAAKLTLSFDFTSDGQSFRRSQMHGQLLDMALHYRMKQRARVVSMVRDDMNTRKDDNLLSLQAREIDYMASGDKQ